MSEEMLKRLRGVRKRIKSVKKTKSGKVSHIVACWHGAGEYVSWDDLERILKEMNVIGGEG